MIRLQFNVARSFEFKNINDGLLLLVILLGWSLCGWKKI